MRFPESGFRAILKLITASRPGHRESWRSYCSAIVSLMEGIMRFPVLASILVLSSLSPVACFSQPAATQPAVAPQVPPPALNARVRVTTALSTYVGVFLGVEAGRNGAYWILRTDTNTVTFPGAIVRDVSPADGTRADGTKTPPIARPPGDVDLRVHGSNTIGAQLAPEFSKAYAAKSGLTSAETKMGPSPEDFDITYTGPGSDRKFVFRFRAHGSATAFEDFLAGETDIGMSSRRVQDREVEILKPKIGNLRAAGAENVIALDGVAVIVNKDNPVTALSLDLIARIFSGEINDWSLVGGAPGPINVYARDRQSGTWDTFKTLVLDPAPRRELTTAAKRFTSSEELSDSVAADPRGIGFIGLAYIRNARAAGITTPCGLRFAAESFLVKSEEYPLSRRLYFYVPESGRSPQVDDFVSYALSAPAQPVTTSIGFISLDFDEAPPAYTAERERDKNIEKTQETAVMRRVTQQFSQTIADAHRLSVTFRFETAKADLDNRAVKDIERLADYIKADRDRAQRIMLFGFADSRGSFEYNYDLARNRAASVARELKAQGVNLPDRQIYPFGLIAPVACNDSGAGQDKNRRVEVWLRH
jgi:phosphate transport system substrate-binding protein